MRHIHTIKNSIDFVNKIKDIKLQPGYRIMSLDIVNLYTNIPVPETLSILKSLLFDANILDTCKVQELIQLLETILSQNYFLFNNQYYIQEGGLAMGSPLSGLLADIYLNYYENTYVLSDHNKFKDNIIFYTRYVDDTFLIFNGTLRQIYNLKTYMNSINNYIQFTLETEVNNRLNFLDLTIYKKDHKFNFSIYRKPTTSDVTLHADSHHPIPQKMAAYCCFIYRLLTIPLDDDSFNEELNTIKYIAQANGYSYSMIDNLLKKCRNKLNKRQTTKPNVKYITSEYGLMLPKILNNVFKKYNFNIAYRTNNNIRNILQPRLPRPLESKTGIYKISCSDCQCFYVGQTGRPFLKRYSEHLPKRDHSIVKSNFAKHLIDRNHSYQDFRTNFKPLHFCKKGRFMDAMEEFQIYKAFKAHHNHILNEQLNFHSNSLYDTALRLT